MEKKLKECVNHEVVISNGLANDDFDFYRLMKEVERIMLEEKVLKNVSADGYIHLVTKVYDGEDKRYLRFYNIVNKQFEKEKIVLYPSFLGFYQVCNYCPAKILIEEKNEMNGSLHLLVQYGNEFEAHHHDKTILIKLIKAIEENNDFDKIEYRTPIIIYLLSEIGEQYFRAERMQNKKSR